MKRCIVNKSDKDIVMALERLGYVCHDVIASNLVSPPICRHSDVLYRKLNCNTIFVSNCQKENKAVLEAFGYNPIFTDKLQPGYKTECLLNFIINDKFIICNPQTAIMLDEQFIADRKIIKVKQGYTSCSTISVTDTAYITDDESISKSLIANNLDCLLIEKGSIELAGYNYGFIGGASVRLNEKEILFFGDLENRKDKDKVINFLKKYNMTALFIKNKKLTDIGSALIL